jgi:SAM-dependent methyltransferase
MGTSTIVHDVAAYYTGRLREHGATARGVDWKDEASQALRFEQLARLWEPSTPVGSPITMSHAAPLDGPTPSLNDYGCGYGALLEFLRARSAQPVAYCGFDISTAMLAEARHRHAESAGVRFVDSLDDLAMADYTVASGVFNVRLGHNDASWLSYMHDVLGQMASRSRRGFAFNALTSYSDADRMRPDLYYADPRHWFDHCKRTYSPRVALLHDYPLWEFTILVRL